MVIIRLARGGAKKRPFFSIIVTDHRNARDGRFIENLGYYNPTARGQEKKLVLEKEKIAQWIAKGAKPSERVAYLLKQSETNPTLEKIEKNKKVKKTQVTAAATELKTEEVASE